MSGGVVEVRASIDFSQFHTPVQMDNELTNLGNHAFFHAQYLHHRQLASRSRPIRGIKITNNVAIDDANKGDVVFIGTLARRANGWLPRWSLTSPSIW